MDLGSDPMTLIIINYVKMVRVGHHIVKPQQIIQEAIKIIINVKKGRGIKKLHPRALIK